MSKIQLNMTTLDIIVAMAEGNPGAIATITDILKTGDAVDPEAMFGGGLAAVLFADTLGIYGSDLNVLWSDLCRREAATVMMVLRAVQLGLLAESVVKTAISACQNDGRRGAALDLRAIAALVHDRLPRFQVPTYLLAPAVEAVG